MSSALHFKVLRVYAHLIIPIPNVVHVHQPCQIIMFSKMLQQSNLSQRPSRQNDLVEHLGHTLDGDRNFRFGIFYLDN